MTDTVRELEDWLTRVSGADWIWYIKFLSANDTGATGAHQTGPLIGNPLFDEAYPSLRERANTDAIAEGRVDLFIDSHDFSRNVRVVWYLSKREGRLTQWGRGYAPMVDHEATGTLVVFAFRQVAPADADVCRVWMCRNPADEDLIQERCGPIEPGRGVLYAPTGRLSLFHRPIERPPACALTPDEIPADWLLQFPAGEQLIDKVIERLVDSATLEPDKRLLQRRDCEYEMFRSIEEATVLPRLLQGFASVDLFVEYANSVLNRRKSRSGRSLELHARRIFDEERLPYSWQAVTEQKKTPDFIFPSIERYLESDWSESKLRMLAVKTTCKDRWRQILNEADRIDCKHLLTLQEGISEHQFDEMQEHNVVLVVPSDLHKRYPASVRPHLLTLAQFVRETNLSCG